MRAKNLFLFIFFISLIITAGDEEKHKSGQLTTRETLSKVRRYCTRLKNGAYHFVCLEEISEKIDHSKDRNIRIAGVEASRSFEQPGSSFRPQLKEKNTYLYDYQLIKKEGEIKEIRILLEKNGRKKNKKNAQLETKAFRHKHILLRTVDLLSGDSEFYNDYKIINEDVLNGEEAIVIEATPKTSYINSLPDGVEPTFLSGKIWIKKTDYNIFKIMTRPVVSFITKGKVFKLK